LDGETINEWMRPVMAFKDGTSAYGLPWEITHDDTLGFTIVGVSHLFFFFD